MRRLFAAVAVVAVATAWLAFPRPPAATAKAPICDDLVEIVAFRGSGEGKIDDGSRSNGWIGPTLKRVLDDGRNATTPDGVSLANVPVYGVPDPDYRAIPVSDYFDLNPFNFKIEPAKMYDSAVTGGAAGYAYILKSRRDCPNRRFILMGYSQGATAARAALGYTPDSWIAGVFLLGDPDLRPNQPYGHGTGAKAAGGSLVASFRSIGLDPDSLIPDVLATRPLRGYSFCHANDIVCDAFLDPGAGIGEHLNYGDDSTERRTLSTEVIGMYRAARENPPPAPGKPAIDVVFAIDTTGSMTPYIDNARTSAERISQQLRTSSSSFRVGVAEYRDHGDTFVARLVTPLTEDTTAFRAGLDTLLAAGGGDRPEAVYSGMITAAGAAWRPEVRRIVIVIGDAPAHDPEPVTGYTRDDVLRAFGAGTTDRSTRARVPLAVPADPIRLYGLAADAELRGQIDAIAPQTGGASFALDSADDVAARIAESLRDATEAPSVTLHAAAPVIAGRPTVLTALDPNNLSGLTYEWDLDGDGTFDRSTADGIVTHTYPATGRVTARVRARDAKDRQSVATQTFTVIAQPGTITVEFKAQPSAGTSPSPTPSGSVEATPLPAAAPAASAPTQLGRTGSPIMLIVLTGLGLVAVGAALLLVRRRRIHTTAGE
jgi:Mg-chelatase subunit ChlD